LKEETKIGWSTHEVSFVGSSLVKLAVASICGGLASAVGLGGGIVFNPVLIGLGVPPTVAASTGMYMIMFSAFLNSLTFYLFDKLSVQYALWIGVWSAIGIAIFLAIVGAIIKKYKRPSIVVFILAAVIALCAIVVPTVNIKHLIDVTALGQDVWAFGQLC
jgi:uncharacterized membrane protein YfcA